MASPDSILGAANSHSKTLSTFSTQCNWKVRFMHSNCKVWEKLHASKKKKKLINKGLWELKGEADEL